MAEKKRQSKQKVTDFAGQLEHVFLAGLGALSNAQKIGQETFDTLVKKGEKFRKEATKKTEELIDDVQDAIKEMGDEAQEKATGLMDDVRGLSKFDKLGSTFDKRVADAMDRMNVPSKNDIDAINRKLNKIVRMLETKDKPAPAKKAAPKRKTTSVKKASVKKTSVKKAPAIKAPVKKTEAQVPVAKPAEKPAPKAA